MNKNLLFKFFENEGLKRKYDKHPTFIGGGITNVQINDKLWINHIDFIAFHQGSLVFRAGLSDMEVYIKYTDIKHIKLEVDRL